MDKEGLFHLIKWFSIPIGGILAVIGGIHIQETSKIFGYVLIIGGLIDLVLCGYMVYLLRNFKM